jgi:hypothetical protein
LEEGTPSPLDRFGVPDGVRWSAHGEPPRCLVDLIVQDEYTYDVDLDHGDGLFLVYDTT